MYEVDNLIDDVLTVESYNKYFKYINSKECLSSSPKERGINISSIFNLDIVGFGGKRVCLRYEDYVLKMPLTINNFNDNLNEIILYKFIKENHPSLLHYLYPIISSKNNLILTNYFNVYSDYDSIDSESFMDEVYKEFSKVGVILGEDFRTQCLGTDDFGGLVLLDYDDNVIGSLSLTNSNIFK